MTTVCAVARDDRVVMGADSMAIFQDRPMLGRVKVVEHPVRDPSASPGHPSVLLGFAGNGALSDVVAADLVIDAAPTLGDDPHPWAVKVAQAISGLAFDYSLTEEGRLDGNVLLGWAGQLWTVHTNGAHRHGERLAAIGSGGPFAVAALHAIDTWPRLVGTAESVEDAVKTAVTIASHLDVYSGGPPLVLSIP